MLSVAKGTVVRGNTPTPSGRREAPSPRTNLRRRRAFEHLVPGAQAPSGYISEHSCDPLALLAALLPDRMLSLVMAEVERMANDPLPVAERAPRIAALERGVGRRRDRGRSARPPLAVGTAISGSRRHGREEGLARRLINEERGAHPPGLWAVIKKIIGHIQPLCARKRPIATISGSTIHSGRMHRPARDRHHARTEREDVPAKALHLGRIRDHQLARR